MTLVKSAGVAQLRLGARAGTGRGRGWPVVVVMVAIFALLPALGLGDYQLSIVTEIVIFAVAAYGLDIVVGQLGLVSVAHATLLTVSAYTVAILTTKHIAGYWLAALVAVVVTTLVGLLLAAVTMRSKGHYFAVITLAFAAAAVVVLSQWKSVTRGSQGIYSIPAPVGFDSTLGEYYLGVVILAFAGALVFLLTRSTLGRCMRAVRTDEVLAASLGINVVGTKLKAFAISSAMTGLAGPLYASWLSYVNPPDASFLQGFNILIYVIIGGSATLAGPVVGTAVVIVVSESFRFANLYQTLIFSVVVFLILMFFRGGIAGASTRLWGVARSAILRQWPRAGGVLRAQTASEAPKRGAGASGSGDARGSGGAPPFAPAGTSPGPHDEPVRGEAVEHALEGRGLTKSYGGVRAVSDVSLDARPAEIVGVIGPNGAGKSTLFGLISGVVGGAEGIVRLSGAEVQRLPAHRRARLGIARTFQTNRLLSDETVWENLLTGSYVHRRRSAKSTRRDHDEQLSSILSLLGLDPDARVSGLSVEEQKLVGIGMALALRPRVLLLDEPFAGLRESETPRLTGILETLRDHGLTILLVEHKMRVVMSLCSRVYVLDSGELISKGTAAQTAEDPLVIKAYLGGKGA